MKDKIEILGTQLLDEQRALADELYRFADHWNVQLGWHYILDLLWILRELGPIQPGMRILDAGACRGILQWWLAEQGAEVISVDIVSRARLSVRFHRRYRIDGLREEDFISPTRLAWERLTGVGDGGPDVGGAVRALTGTLLRVLYPKAKGSVTMYNQDLAHLPELEDACVDAVVAVSSLEHNTMEHFPAVFGELMRVLKPGRPLLATLGASRGDDWFHEPSQGWCYSETTLRRLYYLDAKAASNYGDHDTLFERLRSSKELEQRLAPFYQHIEHSGMPGGIWDPQYQPVGVKKVKPESEKQVS